MSCMCRMCKIHCASSLADATLFTVYLMMVFPNEVVICFAFSYLSNFALLVRFYHLCNACCFVRVHNVPCNVKDEFNTLVGTMCFSMCMDAHISCQ